MFRTVEVSNPAFAPPGIRFVTVKSAALEQRADLLLYVPLQAADLHDVPLVLLLHGAYSSHWAWAFKGAAHLTAQRLIDENVIPPMVLAMPSDGLWGDGSGYMPHGGKNFERWIVDEVPAAACAACDACSEASPLFIAGLSIGGFGALRLAGRYPQRFVAAAGHSSVTDATQMDALMAESRDGWAGSPADTSVLDALRTASTPLPALRFDCGRDDILIDANRKLHADLLQAGVAHEYAEHTGEHDWAYWMQHLEETLRFFGKTLTAGIPAP